MSKHRCDHSDCSPLWLGVSGAVALGLVAAGTLMTLVKFVSWVWSLS